MKTLVAVALSIATIMAAPSIVRAESDSSGYRASEINLGTQHGVRQFWQRMELDSGG